MNFDPPFPLALVVVVAVLAIAVSISRELKGQRRLLPGWLHPLCLILRLVGIGCLTYLLFNPSRQITQKGKTGHSVILLDASASMNLAAEGGRTRWEVGQDFAAKVLDQSNKSREQTRLATFSTDLDSGEEVESPTGKNTHLATALERLLVGGGEDLPFHITVISDGRIHDREKLGNVLALANASKVPISTYSVGIDIHPRNASLEAVHAPRMVRPRSPVAVHVDVSANGFEPDEALRLRIVNEEGEVKAEREFFPPPNSAETSNRHALPIPLVLVFESGLRSEKYRVELETSSDEPEIDKEDNQFSFQVEIATGKLRVLFCEGTHAKRMVGPLGHAWNDMEFMSRAWEATGEIESLCLTPWSQYTDTPNLVGVSFHQGEMKLDRSKNFPQTKEALHQFDVLIVSDVARGNFSEEQMEWVVDWVQNRGGGFLMGGGNTAFDTGNYDQTPWEKIVPVDMRAYGDGRYQGWFDIEIPEAVRDHPLWAVSPDPRENETILKAHPLFTGMNLVRRAKPGALVLAHRKGGDEPVIVAQTYGRGRSVAFMPDPNGGGGDFYIDWGPADSPELSKEARRIELGHGRYLRFNEIVATSDYGPEPSHPSPWYAQYWVNMVRWLGENSVRWQRDQLAGRIVSTRAQPGRKLPIAAEVLSVSELDELLSVNVGARLGGFDSRRVRLLYDRDRREFTGELTVPEEAAERDRLDVIFDVEVNGRLLSQTETVGIHRGNPEFASPSPDPVFLADVARSAGGIVLENPDDAVKEIRETQDERLRLSQASWSEPLWGHWWLWGAVGLCFSMEWAMRRIGSQPRGETELAEPTSLGKAASVILFLFVMGGLGFSQEHESNRTTEEWISQLGSDRVRLRDEAEDSLRKTPGAYEALVSFVETNENEEAGIRARNILRHLKSFRWELIGIRRGHTEMEEDELVHRGLVILPNVRNLYTRARDHIREWNAGSYEPLRTFGESGWKISDPSLLDGYTRALAISPNSKMLAGTGEQGEVIIYDTKSLKELFRFGDEKANDDGIILSAAFMPDHRRIITGHPEGVNMWDIKSGRVLWSSKRKEPARFVAPVPDRQKILVSGDSLLVLAVSNGSILSKFDLPTQLGGLSFDSEAKRLLGHGKDGNAWVYDFESQTGKLSNGRSYGPMGKECQGAIWGADETTILSTGWNPKSPMVEWDLETGEAIWKSPPLEFGLGTAKWIDHDRIAVLGTGGLLTIWKFRGGKTAFE